MAHIAMFNAIDDAKRRQNGTASADAAGARAAHDVLVHEFPGGTTAFDALLAAELAAIPDGPAKTQGVLIGANAAATMLASRANDGSATPPPPYVPGTEPGDYQPTPPFDGPPFNGFVDATNWASVTPFVMKSGRQFRAPAPYKVTDLNYTFDYDEIKSLGSAGSVARSDDQTRVAIFWAESGGLGWNRIARGLAQTKGNDLLANARLFAALNAALADGYIASFDSKFAHNFWRPVTAIHRAADDGNALTGEDSAWMELLFPTPPVPDYPSAHAAVGAAGVAVLIAFFGDENEFMASSTTEPTPRHFVRISDAAKENSISRMLGGIHFRLACEIGYEQGIEVGTWVVTHGKFLERN
jgi:hypothetical protein